MDGDFICCRLSQLRNKKGVSAREMSLAIGQSNSYVNMIENKSFLPSMTEFLNICEYLQITPMEFFDEGIQNPIKLKTIFNDMRSLDDEQLTVIAAMVKSLKNKKTS